MNAREHLSAVLAMIESWADAGPCSATQAKIIHDARNFLSVPEPPPLPAATPITPVHKRVFADTLRRAKAQHERPGVKRDRCAMDVICGAAIAFNAAGDVVGSRSMENAALLVSVRGAQALEELTR